MLHLKLVPLIPKVQIWSRVCKLWSKYIYSASTINFSQTLLQLSILQAHSLYILIGKTRFYCLFIDFSSFRNTKYLGCTGNVYFIHAQFLIIRNSFSCLIIDLHSSLCQTVVFLKLRILKIQRPNWISGCLNAQSKDRTISIIISNVFRECDKEEFLYHSTRKQWQGLESTKWERML